MDGWVGGWSEFIPVESMYFLGGGDRKGGDEYGRGFSLLEYV